MTWLRNSLESQKGKSIAIVLAIGAIGASLYMIKSALSSSVVSAEHRRIFVDAQTGRPFYHDLEKGEVIPVDAPSGQKTGFPAELCYWTKEGQPKQDPTAVLMNSWIGKSGPTFCPECGRLVVPNNPPASPGRRPPPTQQEYQERMIGVGPELLHAVASN
jgi:hypothetical protein